MGGEQPASPAPRTRPSSTPTASTSAPSGPAISVVYHGSYEANPEAVESLPGGKEWRAEIEKIQHQIAEKHGFELLDHSLVLYVKAKVNSGDD